MLKNQTLKRTFYAIIFVLLTIPAFISTAYGGYVGRIVGLIIFGIFGMIGTFEVLIVIGHSKMTSLLTSLLVLIFLITPLDHDTKRIIQDGEIIIDGEPAPATINHLIKLNFMKWSPWVVMLSIALLPNVLDMKFKMNKKFWQHQILLLILAFIIPIFIKMAWMLNIDNINKFIYFVMMAIISDTLAYFGGMLFGKKWFKGKKFAPQISPKKTWAGFIVGFLSATFFGIIFGYYGNVWDTFNNPIIISVLASILIALICPFGDLFFSWIKRRHNVKDFSNLIPGHGGIFDRFDAMSIVFVVGFLLYWNS